ncbi:apolipoprotein D-like [Schistocerca serialis cubense]|uniref:apolipoprotein D-like n=1 Tax=Schistocerca serialis cubense TaxID=2023355 RepID=UPI00214E1F07|nr:apolipoprotein D-like [Schistocerca serialis cubense]
MMAVLYKVAILLATASVSVGHQHKHHMCPPPFGMKSFDADRFQGDWYVVSQYIKVPFAPEGKMCLQLNYIPSGTGENPEAEISVRIKKETELKDVELRCVPAGPFHPPGKGSAVSVCVLKLNETKWYPTLQHQILSTDYTSFAVTQTCLVYYDAREDEFRRVFAVDVLSRQPSMPKEELQLLKSIASSGEADIEKFRDIDNGDC